MGSSTYRVLALSAAPREDQTAVAECSAVIDGVRAPNGRAYSLPHRVNAVLRREGGRWQFVSLHPSFSA
jgi:hypothetical protein